jgi:uncharacterized protein with GYD domain
MKKKRKNLKREYQQKHQREIVDVQRVNQTAKPLKDGKKKKKKKNHQFRNSGISVLVVLLSLL